MPKNAGKPKKRYILLAALAAAAIFLSVLLLTCSALRRNAPSADSAEPAAALPQTDSGAPVTDSPAVPPPETGLPETTLPETTLSETGLSESAPAAGPVAVHPVLAENAVSLGEQIDSGFAALLSLSTGEITAQKDAFARMYPASMTKIMTLIVGYEHAGELNETFTVTSAIIDPLYRAEASLAGFAPGESVTIRDLLYGTILPSGAEAAVSLAIHTAGSEEDFVALMNEKAQELGLSDTHFTNCTGLHDAEHYSTCADVAAILAYALQYEECREILSTYQYTTSATEQHPEGVLLTSTVFSRMYGDEADGVTILAGKTGYTPEAGQCLASYAERESDGAGFILVTSDAAGKFEPVFDAIQLYSDYAG